jgi:tripartite-type tricarboxylate transporter receptor subunit TctC
VATGDGTKYFGNSFYLGRFFFRYIGILQKDKTKKQKEVVMRKRMFVTCCLVNCLFILVLLNFVLERAWGAEGKYPSKSIELFSADPAGAYADLVNRFVVKALEKYLNVVIVPGNRPGGGDQVAASFLAHNAAPDGYTLSLLADGPLVYSHMVGTAAFLKDEIRVVGQIVCSATCMYINAESPWKTFKEFMDYAHKNPGLTYGHMGIGTAIWARAEYLNKVGNLKMRAVPLQGSTQVLTAVLGKHVDVGFSSYAQAKQQEDAGKTRVLFSFTPPGFGPDPNLPTIPSTFGKGVPDMPPPCLHLTAPGKTPENIIKVLEEALEKVSKDPEFTNNIKKLYGQVCFVDSNAIKVLHKEKALQLEPIFREAGLMK